MTENKKIVRSSVSALVQMSDEDLENQIKKELEEIKLKKQKAVQIKKQRQKVFENQNRKKRTHALILFATDYIKTEQMLSQKTKTREDKITYHPPGLFYLLRSLFFRLKFQLTVSDRDRNFFSCSYSPFQHQVGK